jgi:hypothetical protein
MGGKTAYAPRRAAKLSLETTAPAELARRAARSRSEVIGILRRKA